MKFSTNDPPPSILYPVCTKLRLHRMSFWLKSFFQKHQDTSKWWEYQSIWFKKNWISVIWGEFLFTWIPFAFRWRVFRHLPSGCRRLPSVDYSSISQSASTRSFWLLAKCSSRMCLTPSRLCVRSWRAWNTQPLQEKWVVPTFLLWLPKRWRKRSNFCWLFENEKEREQGSNLRRQHLPSPTAQVLVAQTTRDRPVLVGRMEPGTEWSQRLTPGQFRLAKCCFRRFDPRSRTFSFWKSVFIGHICDCWGIAPLIKHSFDCENRQQPEQDNVINNDDSSNSNNNNDNDTWADAHCYSCAKDHWVRYKGMIWPSLENAGMSSSKY